MKKSMLAFSFLMGFAYTVQAEIQIIEATINAGGDRLCSGEGYVAGTLELAGRKLINSSDPTEKGVANRLDDTANVSAVVTSCQAAEHDIAAGIYTPLSETCLSSYVSSVEYDVQSDDTVTWMVTADAQFDQTGSADAAIVNVDIQFALVLEDFSIYDNQLNRGANRFLFTGSGLHSKSSLVMQSPLASGGNAISVKVNDDDGSGSHWKLMLFANGGAASYNGIDLTGYTSLEFEAKSSSPARLQGAFGSGDDSAARPMSPVSLTSDWTTFSVQIADLNLTDINTFLWLYLHRDLNPGDLSGLEVKIRDVKLISEQ